MIIQQYLVPLLNYSKTIFVSVVTISVLAISLNTNAAILGGRVWNDTNPDGVQGPPGFETGMGGIRVNLYECGSGSDASFIDTRVTNMNGLYQFGPNFPVSTPLYPGSYFVEFILPEGFDYTQPKTGSEGGTPDDIAGSDRTDSDCFPPDGITACTTLTSKSINLQRDCGLVPALPVEPVNCNLDIDLQCRVEPQPTTMPTGDKCQGKLQQFNLTWYGSGPVTIDSVNMGTTSASGAIEVGETVTFSGPYSSNDVVIELSGADAGHSMFHVSCSDDDFNSPDDCGKRAGDGKNNYSSKINAWELNGFVDANGAVLSCSPPIENTEFSQDCIINAIPAPSCETSGKPTSLTFMYTGGNCPGDNEQGYKAECSGAINATDMVTIEVDTRDDYTVSPAVVAPGELFTITRNFSKFKSNTEISLTDSNHESQLNRIHTSCSVPLAIGDVFGALTLVAINGETGGAAVTYRYTVTNTGDDLTNIHVTDYPLGNVGTIDFLAAGDSESLTLQTTLTAAAVNVASASAILDGTTCLATDQTSVTLLAPPPCEVTAQPGIKWKKKSLEWKIENPGTVPAVIKSIELSWPAYINGYLDKIKLGGKKIVKDKEDGPEATITSFYGKEAYRTIKPGDTETIKLEFKNYISKQLADYGVIRIVFEEGCEVIINPAEGPPYDDDDDDHDGESCNSHHDDRDDRHHKDDFKKHDRDRGDTHHSHDRYKHDGDRDDRHDKDDLNKYDRKNSHKH